jgi:hypothetical protein
MSVSSKNLARDDSGNEVRDLQLRLAGFRGTVWDGQFGPGTELQVISFQRDYMEMGSPDGVVGPNTIKALNQFARDYPVRFAKLKCPCGTCEGYGQKRFKKKYRNGRQGVERYHRYEYPGIHKAILNTFRAAQFYLHKAGFDLPYLTSGYRCWINNEQKGRSSTNHMGKALDCDFQLGAGEDKRDDINRCNSARSILVEKCNFQIGWSGKNQKSLEPSNIAPSWIHMDVRSFASDYLKDEYFVTSAADLNRS